MSRDERSGDPWLVYHDLNAVYPQGDAIWLFLTPLGTFDRLWWGDVMLKDGMNPRLFCEDVDDDGNRDDLVGEGVAHFDERSGRWVGIIRRGSLRNRSDFADDESHWCLIHYRQRGAFEAFNAPYRDGADRADEPRDSAAGGR